MGFHALSDFESATRSAVFDGFPRNPQVEGKLSGGDGDDHSQRADAEEEGEEGEEWEEEDEEV